MAPENFIVLVLASAAEPPPPSLPIIIPYKENDSV